MVPEATIVIKLSHLYNYRTKKSKTHLKPNHQLKCLNANKGIVFNAYNHNKDTIFVVFFQFSNVHSKMPLDLRVQMFKCQRANTTKGLLTLQSCFTPPLNVSVSKSDISHLLPRLPLLIPLLLPSSFLSSSIDIPEKIRIYLCASKQPDHNANLFSSYWMKTSRIIDYQKEGTKRTNGCGGQYGTVMIQIMAVEG